VWSVTLQPCEQLVHTDGVLHWVFLVGLLTAITGSVLMLTQNDIKKALGYSTMGQMGFMIMECGVGAFSLAIYHLIAHGLFKGTLFLGAGGVINEARQNDNVPKDDLYTFIVEREPARMRQPWLLMAAITLRTVLPAVWQPPGNRCFLYMAFHITAGLGCRIKGCQ